MKRLCAFVALLLLTTGCGSGNVKGTVRFKGETLKSGTVTATASNGVSVQSLIDSEGRYEVKGLATRRSSCLRREPKAGQTGGVGRQRPERQGAALS